MQHQRTDGSPPGASRLAVPAALTLGPLGLVMLIFAVTYVLVTDRFLTIEADAMQRDVARARDALQSDLRSLNSKAGDWSNWSDPYNFMTGANPRFLEV